MNELLDILLSASLWAAAIRIASPLIFATMGELICERAGVLNLGIEGIMVIGAFTGWVAVYMGAPLWWGVAAAMLAGMAFGLIHAVLTVPFGLSQHGTERVFFPQTLIFSVMPWLDHGIHPDASQHFVRGIGDDGAF